MEAPKAVLFAATHRSGSTLLMETLKRMDWIGRPGEAFYPQNIAEMLRRHGKEPDLHFHNWLPEVIAAGRSPTGWFSSKIFADNLRWLAQLAGGQEWPDSAPALTDFFREYFPGAIWIRIRRKDQLRQGISLLKALQSGLWHSTQRKIVQARKPYYQRDLLEWAVHNISQQEATLDHFFATLGVSPTVLYYEDFSKDIAGAVAAIGLTVGQVAPALPEAAPGLERLSNPESESWLNRWQTEEEDMRRSPQPVLDRPEEPVFRVSLELPQDPVLPGARVEVPFSVTSLRDRPLRFMGKPDRVGTISLWLQVVADDGSIQQEKRLPNPYLLEGGETAELLFHLDVPREPARYTIRVTGRQNGLGPVSIVSDAPWPLEVSNQLEADLRKVFGEVQITPDNWYYSPWFGYFYANAFPWVLSVHHGWLRVETDLSSMQRLTVYDFVLGTWTTSADRFPSLELADGTSLRHQSTENGSRTFIRGDGAVVRHAVSEQARPSAADAD